MAAPVLDTAASPASPERTDFAQEMINSLNSVAQQQSTETYPATQQSVEMQNLVVADPPIDAGGLDGARDTAVGPIQEVGTTTTGTDAAGKPTATDLEKPTTAVPTSTNDATQTTSRDSDGIGPATEHPSAQHVSAATGPQLVITLLLHSTDTRHPYLIDQGYLERRGVHLPDQDPANMSVYTLKELILRDWRPEWEAKPASPSSIRLIHMGRLLEDKWHLKDARFSPGPAPHIVHMTIKPPDVVDDEDARMGKGGKGSHGGAGAGRGSVCRCLVM